MDTPTVRLTRQIQHTAAFLRMTAIEMRRIAENAPDIAIELQHIARQLEADADDLWRWFA